MNSRGSNGTQLELDVNRPIEEDPGRSGCIIRAVSLSAGYEDVTVVRDIDLHVCRGELVALLGPNGAGKTTTLLAMSGVLPPSAGSIEWRGIVTKARLSQRARDGLGFIPEERAVFMSLSCVDNLRVAGVDTEEFLELFPELRSRMRVKAGNLSGGEQQMLVVGRALALRPCALLADELSLGLAPLAINRLLMAVRQAVDTSGVGALIVEQHVQKVLEVADRVYVLSRGRIVASGTPGELKGRLDEIHEAYLSSVPSDSRTTA
jgi:ABC-type branched-subunit amino acid transport system ATPase component